MSTVVGGGVAAASIILSTFGFSRPPSRALELPSVFRLTVREVRTESSYEARADSLFASSSKLSLTHYGRIEGISGGANRGFTVFTDSLLLEQYAPLRFTARVSRDTVAVTSAGSPRTQTPRLESGEATLKCLFEGPSLYVITPERAAGEQIRDLKTNCAGGLYRRLNLPVTLAAFLFRVPPGGDRSGSRWESTEICPSFSGLGYFPQVRWAYKWADARKESERPGSIVEIACDTTLSNVRALSPSGDAVGIISDHIRVRGAVRPWGKTPFLFEGTIKIQEDIRYVRPALESPVLRKSCDVEILLSPF